MMRTISGGAMPEPSSNNITQLLLDWRNGDQAALEHLMPIVYDELRRLARHYMVSERPGHTLQSTALIHEAYLQLVDRHVPWEGRAHFFGIAARLMRQILIQHARARFAQKRGGDHIQVTLDDVDVAHERASDLVELDDALKRLAALDPRQAQIVELKYFGGLTIDETAEVLEISHATVEREWSLARAWLRQELQSDS
jgi:RNA polymerase sigma-70 factor (ECF subfamily)